MQHRRGEHGGRLRGLGGLSTVASTAKTRPVGLRVRVRAVCEHLARKRTVQRVKQGWGVDRWKMGKRARVSVHAHARSEVHVPVGQRWLSGVAWGWAEDGRVAGRPHT